MSDQRIIRDKSELEKIRISHRKKLITMFIVGVIAGKGAFLGIYTYVNMSSDTKESIEVAIEEIKSPTPSPLIDSKQEPKRSLDKSHLPLSFTDIMRQFNQPLPSPPTVRGTGTVVMDAYTGDILWQNQADNRHSPASLAKLMTSFIVADAVKSGQVTLNDEVPVSVNAWRTGGSRMFIQEGRRVRLEDLVRGLIIQSGNDAAVALAEYIAGSTDAFVQRMNDKATALGLNNTQFANVMGFTDASQYTTARDLALLTRALINEHPEFHQYYSEIKFTFNDIEQYNRNRLLRRDDRVNGMKTGWTQEAGYNLVTTAKDKEWSLIIATMGHRAVEHRFSDTQELINYAYRFFKPVQKEKGVIWQGHIPHHQETLLIGLPDDVYLIVPDNAKVDWHVYFADGMPKQVHKGDNIGILTLKINNKEWKNYPLVAMNTPESNTWWQHLLKKNRYPMPENHLL